MTNVNMIHVSDDMYKEVSQNLAVKTIPPIDRTGKCSVIGKYVDNEIVQINRDEQERAKTLGFAVCKQYDNCDCPICI